MIDNAKRMVASLTSLGIALLGLGIVASLLSLLEEFHGWVT